MTRATMEKKDYVLTGILNEYSNDNDGAKYDMKWNVYIIVYYSIPL